MFAEPVARASLSIQQFTSSEAGAWSNSYLISGRSEAVLFDVFQLRGDATRLAESIAGSGKTLTTVMVSHAHPDHFMGLDVITARFPDVEVVSTPSVVADIEADGPWMFSLLQQRLGSEGPTQLVVPRPLSEPALRIEGIVLDIVEFGEGESKHMACLHVPEQRALLAADIVYHQAHLYLRERHLESWLARLDELEAFARDRVTTIHPGHGAPARLELIAQTRDYLNDFASAVQTGDAGTAERQLLARYPNHHVTQFLTVFSLPAYFP
jgi:glyoxylase-like metal-dependent hydrolase (beta-lactamase superfamily II)